MLDRIARNVYVPLRNIYAYVENSLNLQSRRLRAHREPLSPRFNSSNTERLAPFVRSENPPWAGVSIPFSEIPGMISEEECKYYIYLGQYYLGRGAVVELGPWLGRSTFFIVRGLYANPNFRGKRLKVFDDFVWRAEWMDPSVLPEERLPNHADFQFLFKQYTGSIASALDVSKRRMARYEGNENVAPLVWRDEPVEMMFIDCGRTLEANNAWYNLFAPYWIPNVTLLVLQDWGTHRELPVRHYNQIKQFVDSKGKALQLVHELKYGEAAMFLYRGEGER